MNLQMDIAPAAGFNSRSQMVRVITEAWAASSLYCAACTSDSLTQSPPGTAAVDFVCPECGAPYQLKSSAKPPKNRIVDAGYEAMMRAINNDATPHLFVLHYTPQWQVQNLLLVPKFFFNASAIHQRKPLAKTARRADWVGCDIMLSAIATEGKLPVIENGIAQTATDIRTQYQKVSPIASLKVELRGWALDVFSCISRIGKKEFTLTEVYKYSDHLSKLHPENNNVDAKTRQQLQVLRDAGLIEFVSRGHYRLKV